MMCGTIKTIPIIINTSVYHRGNYNRTILVFPVGLTLIIKKYVKEVLEIQWSAICHQMSGRLHI